MRKEQETSSNELDLLYHTNAQSSGHEPRLSMRQPETAQWNQVPRNLSLFSAISVPMVFNSHFLGNAMSFSGTNHNSKR